MGGSKSKPVVETARQVLAKRKVEVEAASSAIRDAAAEVDLIPYIQVWYDPEVALRGTKYEPDVNDMDVDTIQEMSKWDLFSSTTENAQVCSSIFPLSEASAHLLPLVSQVLDKSSKIQPGDVASAALLRIQEEKEMDRKMAEIVQSNIQNRTQVPQIRAVKGRISEAKLVAMYNRFRYTFVQISGSCFIRVWMNLIVCLCSHTGTLLTAATA